jgi:rod shape-determining protein MreD
LRIFFRYAVVLAAAVYVQHAVAPRLLPDVLVPDLTLATVVYVALAVGGVPAVVLGFVLGLASDLLGWGPVGAGALVGTISAAAFSYFRGQIYEGSLVVPAAFAAVSALAKQFLTFALLAAFAGPVSFGWHVFGKAALAAGSTAAFSFALFFFYWRFLPPRAQRATARSR